MDDGISVAPHFSKCARHSFHVRLDLAKPGFVSNEVKYLQVICWLGIFGDFKNNCMFIPKEKNSEIVEGVGAICPVVTFLQRNLLVLQGEFYPIFSVIMGNISKLMTKSVHRLIECRGCWEGQLVLDSDVQVELKFWREHLRSFYCRPIWKKPVLCCRVVFSDASALKCAALISMNGKPVSHKNWDAIEMRQSSTWRELMCVKLAL